MEEQSSQLQVEELAGKEYSGKRLKTTISFSTEKLFIQQKHDRTK
jgi:hypothetical protein